MDNFKEEVVVRKQGRAVSAIGFVMCWILIVAFGLYGMIGLSGILSLDFQVANFVSFIVGGGVAFLLYRYKDNFRTEYEYTFTNGEMDVAKVLGNSRRKQLTTVRMREKLDSFQRELFTLRDAMEKLLGKPSLLA